MTRIQTPEFGVTEESERANGFLARKASLCGEEIDQRHYAPCSVQLERSAAHFLRRNAQLPVLTLGLLVEQF